MLKRLLVILLLLVPSALHYPATADDRTAGPKIQEEIWSLPFPLPVLAYVVRPVGDGPFPLMVMNHGISLDANQRAMFPMVEYRDAAYWFARRFNELFGRATIFGFAIEAPSMTCSKGDDRANRRWI